MARSKVDLRVYIMPSLGAFAPALQRLGRHKAGMSCRVLRRLADADGAALLQLIGESVAAISGQRIPAHGTP